jgi:serine phosphatase RsbU (regulator of sigma subunit)
MFESCWGRHFCNLAKQIQDSQSPTMNEVDNRIGTLKYYQRRFGALGGDWIAFRENGPEELVIAIADITGKGLAAALVSQTIHSLWVRCLSHEPFDAISWIREVNSTLFSLSKTTSHTATLCVVQISKDFIHYYSCGHVPLFLMIDGHGTEHDTKLMTVVGQGTLVGTGKELDMNPANISLSAHKFAQVLVGTDGVFHRGTRTSSRYIRQLLTALDQGGESALDHIGSEDDKLLALVNLRKREGQ